MDFGGEEGIVENEIIMEMKMKRANGTYYALAVSERDGRVWHNGKPYIDSESGNRLVMKDLVDYCTCTLSPEGKEFVASLYKRTEPAEGVNNRVVSREYRKHHIGRGIG